MIDLDAIERRANAATPGPWYVHDRPADFWTVGTDPDWPFECEVFDDGSARGEYNALCSIADRDFLVAARTDVPALIARVRELEAECAKRKEAFERIRSTNTDLMMQLFEAQEKARAVNISPVLHENAQLRSHARAVSNLLAIIHGDGGHYEGKHGTVKACKDAEGVVSDLRLKQDAATYALGEKP